MNDTLSAALRYLDRGWSVIPVGPDKKPLGPWKEFQSRHATPEEVEKWFTQHPKAMVGIVCGEISDLAGVDIDSEEGEEALAPYLPESLYTPVALTPRGFRHLYFRSMAGFPTTAGVLPGVDTRGNGGYLIAPPSVNGTGKGYTWAISPDDAEAEEVPESFAVYIKKYIHIYKGCDSQGGKDQSQKSQASQDVTLNLSKGKRNESLFSIALSLLKGGMPAPNILYSLRELNERCAPPLSDSEVLSIFKSAQERQRRRERNFQQDLIDLASVTSCDISVTEAYDLVTSVTEQEKAAVRQALLRLSRGENPVWERIRAGLYRPVVKDVQVMDLRNAPTQEFKIDLPLGLSDLVKLFPSNIIIVAGSKSAGKTTFLLNVARLNMNRYPVDYLNSEMAEAEFRGRLEAFPSMTLDDWNWQNFRPIRRSSDWWDLITDERKIFIVDFMELDPSHVYEAGRYLKKIHDRLKHGICFVGLQKPPDRDDAFGGAFTKEKSRLYLSLDYDRQTRLNSIKITDCKVPRGRNPRGLRRTYKLTHNGSTYTDPSAWIETK